MRVFRDCLSSFFDLILRTLVTILFGLIVIGELEVKVVFFFKVFEFLSRMALLCCVSDSFTSAAFVFASSLAF